MNWNFNYKVSKLPVKNISFKANQQSLKLAVRWWRDIWNWESFQYSIKDKDAAKAASERQAAVTRDSVSQTAY